MAPFTLSPLPLPATAPSSAAPLRISFRVPTSQLRRAGGGGNNLQADAIFPATGLQLCLHHGGHEVFVERTTSREVEVTNEGSDWWECAFTVPGTELLKFKPKAGAPGADEEAEAWLFAWQGEKVLGKWKLGELPGCVLRVQ